MCRVVKLYVFCTKCGNMLTNVHGEKYRGFCNRCLFAATPKTFFYRFKSVSFTSNELWRK